MGVALAGKSGTLSSRCALAHARLQCVRMCAACTMVCMSATSLETIAETSCVHSEARHTQP